jgi:hypothetical protein
MNIYEVITRTIAPVWEPETLNKAGGEVAAGDDVQGLLKFREVGEI